MPRAEFYVKRILFVQKHFIPPQTTNTRKNALPAGNLELRNEKYKSTRNARVPFLLAQYNIHTAQ